MTAASTVEDRDRIRERRAWYGYDWAVSSYVIIVGTVLFSPYLISVSERAACGRVGTDAHPCRQDLTVLGVHASPGSLVFYVVTVATIVSAVTLPIVGAIADRTPRRRVLMCGLGWVGSVCAAGMFFVAGTDWELGAVLLFLGNVCLGSSLVVYNAILCDVALPEERDAVSSRGWALGYLGGGLLLAIDLVLVLAHDTFGLDKAMAVRLCFVTAGALVGRVRVHPVPRAARPAAGEPVVATDRRVRSAGQSLGQLLRTLREMRAYPVTLLFLVAYLFFNDGIQTVVTAASTYGEKQLGFSTSALIATILLVQFVAFGGALAFGRAAGRFGAHRTILFGLVAWVVIVVFAFFLPAHRLVPFLVAAVAHRRRARAAHRRSRGRSSVG